jgi:hypothetical protein
MLGSYRCAFGTIAEGTNGAKENGAQGRVRTTDTAIFSRVLYQLSYLGARCRQSLGATAVHHEAAL